jgi:ubiquinone/menaquinone biosynthesis C-methylase UbiE
MVNVSDGGAFLNLPDVQVHPPRNILVRLTLGDRAVELPAEVVRVTTVAPHGLGLGVQFHSAGEPAAEQIHNFVLARLLAEIAEIMEGDPRPVDPRNVSVFRGVAQVAAALSGMLEAEGDVPGTLFQRDVGELIDIQLAEADETGLVVTLKDPNARQPAARDHIHLTLTRGSFNAHAHTHVRTRTRERVTLDLPSQLTVFELRRAPRRAPGPEEMYVQIPLPFPPGKKLRREVLDISSTGLAFKVLPEEAYFLPGTPLREVVISGAGGDGERRKSAQVMHITPVSDERGRIDHLRVGVDFGITDDAFSKGTRPRPAGEKRSVSFVEKMGLLIGRMIPRRGPPAPVTQASSGVEVIRYSNKRREDIVALLNTTPRGGRRLHAPVIVIPPAHGKRKESTSVFAQMLVESFAKARRDVVVLRFDGVRNIGESYKDPECREQGREGLRNTLSQAVEDIQTTLDYVYNSPLFTPTEVVLCGFSLQGVPTRRAAYLDQGRRVHYLIGVNGAPAAQEVIRNAAGGVDYIAAAASGQKVGTAAILGITIEGDRYADDLIRSGLAFMSDAKREIGALPIPVTWILGRYDAWIDPATIREFMAVPAPAARELIELDCGHLPLNSYEAIEMFSQVVKAIGRQILREELEPVLPDVREIQRVRGAEWRRVPKSPLPDRRSYWQGYLLGDAAHKLSYDCLNASEDYLAFLDRESELLDLRPEHVVADMGCGTGNFAARLLRRHGNKSRTPIARLHLVDFVPGALDEAERKLAAIGQQQGAALPVVARHLVNLDISPIRTLRRFVAGELFGYDALKGIVRGLVDYSIDTWRACEDWRLHDIVRGRELDKQDLAYIRAGFPPDEQEVILDMNRLTRWLRGRATVEDLTRDGKSKLERSEPIAPHDLRLSRLSLRPSDAVERLPFADASLDRINCSLVLSYLSNPLELLREFYRILKPGGRIVVSSMQPDADMSRIYQRLLYRIEADPNLPLPRGMDRATFVGEARHFLNSAAFLFMLAEEGQFAFFSREELCNLVERAGFRRVESHPVFGDPPQAHVTVGIR